VQQLSLEYRFGGELLLAHILTGMVVVRVVSHGWLARQWLD
jgi:hypothetical protein